MILSLLVGVGSASATPAAVAQATTLHLAVIADLDGEFADFQCKGKTVKPSSLARLVGSIRARSAALAESGGSLRTVVTGDFIGASTAARYILSKAERGGAGLASALTRTSTVLAGLGNGELAVSPAATEAFFRAVRKNGVAAGCVNLTCAATRADVCGDDGRGALSTYAVDGHQVGLFALQYDDLDGKVDPAHVNGLTFGDPSDATLAALNGLSKRGAKLRIAVVHRGRHGSPEEELTQMAEALRGWVDVVLTDAVSAGATTPRIVRVGLGEKAVTVIGVPGGASIWHEVKLTLNAQGHVVRADVSPRVLDDDSAVDPPVAKWLRGVERRYCDRWARPIGQLKLAQDYDEAEFVWLALHVMRESASADVGVVNQGAFQLDHGFPLKGTITRDDLFRLFRFRNEIVRVKLTGAELLDLVSSDPGDDAGKRDLHWVGVDVRDEQVFVNGRALDSRLTYTLVTLDFLARGGDGTFAPFSGGETIRRGKARLLRDHVAAWLLKRGDKPLGSVDSAFVDYWDRPLWRLSFNGKVDMNSTSYSNDAGYIDPHLTNLAFRQLDVSIDTILRMNTRHHGWNNRIVVNYSQTDGTDRSMGQSIDYSLVNTDVIRGETSYELRYLRDTVFDRAWWAPLVTVYGRTRAEIDVPEGQRYRWADVDGLVGLAWEIGPNFQFRSGAGLNRELLRTSPAPYSRSMLQAGYLLERYPILTIGDTKVMVQLEGDVRIKGLGKDQRETYYLDNNVMMQILGPLMVYAQLELFAMRVRGPTQDFVDPNKGETWTNQLRFNIGLSLSGFGSQQMH